jgi:ankyrin repeat protein
MEVDAQDELKRTALIIAAHRGNTDTVKVLLKEDATLGEVDILGRTALHWAAWQGSEAVVRLLLAAGAQVDVKDTEGGRTPMDLATLKGRKGVLSLLIRELDSL